MLGKAKIFSVNSINPEADIIDKAVKIIKAGGVVIFPTKCLYGLAVDALNDNAIKRLFKIKKRSLTNPILVLINQTKDLDNLVNSVPDIGQALIDRFWPGDITIVFDAKKGLPGALTATTGKIGIRMPQHPVARALVKSASIIPLTGTSANISGKLGCNNIKELDPALIDEVDMVLDAGELKGGIGSTVVDATGNCLKILRQGTISEDQLPLS